MDTAIDRVATSLRLRTDIKELAKLGAEKTHRSLCNYIEYLILKDNNKYEYPYSDNVPNEETIGAMNEEVSIKDAIDFSSDESFLKSQGL